MQRHTYDIIIIGAGVAGLTAAIYALRAGKSALVLEAKIPGGQIVQVAKVHNWPGAQQISGEALTQNIYAQARSLGAEFVFDPVTSLKALKSGFHVQTPDTTYTAHALILATGSRDKPLGLANETQYLGHGLSFCATCDGALYQGQDIAVVGGGNTAFYDVLYLANLARKVYLVHRRDTFRADAVLVEKARQLPNVEFVLGMVPHALRGDPNLTQLVVTPYAPSNAHPTSRTLDISAVFVAVGREPATNLFADLVDLDANGYILADEDCQTSHPGVFAAGDCRTKSVRQLVTAAADGAIAATSAVNYLNR